MARPAPSLWRAARGGRQNDGGVPFCCQPLFWLPAAALGYCVALVVIEALAGCQRPSAGAKASGRVETAEADRLCGRLGVGKDRAWESWSILYRKADLSAGGDGSGW